MKLFYSPGACSLAPRIIIHELGLACDFVAVDLSTKKLKNGEDYLQINAKGAVPALQLDNNQLLTENAVILQYLAEKELAQKLLPPVTDFHRYRVLEWLNYVATELHKGFSPLFNPKLSKEVKEKVFLPLLQKKLDYVENHFQHSKNKYLLGDDFTLPDAYFCVMLFWLSVIKIDIAEWPHLRNYFNELKNRKSVMEAFADENIKS